MNARRYAELASLILAAAATFVIVHRVTGTDYPGYVHAFGVVVDEGLAALWLAAATVAMLHPRSSGGFCLLAFAAVGSLVYGLMYSIALASGLGLVFVAAAIVLAVAARRSLPAWHLDAPPPPVHRASVRRPKLS